MFKIRYKSHHDVGNIISKFTQNLKASKSDFLDLLNRKNKNKQLGIYFHTPYCDKICSFCNMNRKQLDNDLEEYTKYICDEIKKYGVDAFRYYLLREANFGTDGDYSTKGIIGRLNSDLANDLGNLLNRTLGMYKKYFNDVIVSSSASEAIDEEIKSMFNEVIKDVEKYMYLFEFSRALETIWRFISRLNKYIDETMPWALAKDESKKDRLAAVMNILCEGLYKIAFLIAPYMPMSAQKISNQLGIDKDITDVKFDDVKEWNIFKEGHKLGEASPIFPRIEIEKEEVVEKYNNHIYDEVYVIYNKFISALRYDLTCEKIIPIARMEGEVNSEYIFEPSTEYILSALLPRFINLQIYQAILNNTASEHSARKNSMGSATDNADEMIKTLNIQYNRNRQTAITQEITEIVGGASAL